MPTTQPHSPDSAYASDADELHVHVYSDESEPDGSKYLKTSIFHHLERAFDWCFLSTIVIAPAALVALGYCVWMGWWGLAALALVVMLGASVGIYGRYIAPWQLQVTRLDFGARLAVARRSIRQSVPAIPMRADGQLRVAFFSDLHLARIKKRAWVQHVVDTCNQLKPDAVLIGGDFVTKLGKHTFEDLLEPFTQLHAPRGIYAVLGNHDYGLPGKNHVEEIERALVRHGVRLLRNECVNLDGRVQLLSVDEMWAGLDNIELAFAQARAKHTTQSKRIFLGHNPDLMLKTKPEQRADLFIFGHTHHGQIYVPFMPGLAVPIHSKFYRGAFETQHGPVYVSAGVGDANSPVRIGTWPEVVVFDI